MRILFDATVFQLPFTGIAKSTLCLYEHCLRKDATFQFHGIHRRKFSDLLSENIQTELVGRLYPERLWNAIVIPKAVKKIKPDVVHFPWNGQVPRGIEDAVVATTIHDVLPLEIPDFFEGKLRAKQAYLTRIRRDIERSDIIFTVSQYSKKQILDRLPVSESDIVVIQHGPTLDQPKGKYGANDDYFIYVGGYGKRKNLPRILETYLEVHNRGAIESKLFFVGTPSFISTKFDSMLRQGKELGLVQEKGYVADDELASLLSAARALIYPSEYEGFGLPALEAMNLGCPVVTTRGTAIPEVCGDAAYYINPANDEEFCRAYIDLEKNPSLREELIRKGRQQAKLFCWNNSTRIFISTLEKVVKA